MELNPHRLLQMLSIVPVLGGARLLALAGRSTRAMGLLGRHLNSPWWKSQSFAGYVPTAQDVFVATFAKSGTNWMLQITQQIACLGTAEFDHIHDVVPWPDAPFPEIRAHLNGGSGADCAPTGLRVIKTHFEREYVPFNSQARYITVIRDPKEVVVSSYYFGQAVLDSVGVKYDLETWLAAARVPQIFLFGDWAAHTAGWWAVRDRPNVYVVTYGELKRNMVSVIRSIADFLGVALTLEQLESIVEKSSFAWMKAHEPRFRPLTLPLRGKKIGPRMMRSGKAGRSAELLSEAQQAVVDRYFSGRLMQLGSDFPYEEMF